MTDEEYVRANWVRANYFPMSKCVAICDGSQTTGPMTCFDGPDTQAWAAAAAFTRDRLEKIRQLERQIELVQDEADANGWLWNAERMRDHATWMMLRHRLESALADLKRGMAIPTCDSPTDPAATP
jgi:hypothetical protein